MRDTDKTAKSIKAVVEKTFEHRTNSSLLPQINNASARDIEKSWNNSPPRKLGELTITLNRSALGIGAGIDDEAIRHKLVKSSLKKATNALRII
jgi:hypothetical protein